MNHADLETATHDYAPAEEDISQEVPAPTGPKPLIQGSFALFAMGKGLVLSTYTEEAGDKHVKVPGWVVKQMRKQSPELGALLDQVA